MRRSSAWFSIAPILNTPPTTTGLTIRPSTALTTRHAQTVERIHASEIPENEGRGDASPPGQRLVRRVDPGSTVVIVLSDCHRLQWICAPGRGAMTVVGSI